ncbi:hypothetical protein GCM10010331_36180 [Streptomyces xanthochromogenes]|nr:hypothetical protein GCM10010331_36180 [Streptomyces xanthochromogenes]
MPGVYERSGRVAGASERERVGCRAGSAERAGVGELLGFARSSGTRSSAPGERPLAIVAAPQRGDGAGVKQGAAR